MPLLASHLLTKKDKKDDKITQEQIAVITRSLAEGIEGLLFQNPSRFSTRHQEEDHLSGPYHTPWWL